MPATTKRYYAGQRNPGKCTNCGGPTPWRRSRRMKTCSPECRRARTRAYPSHPRPPPNKCVICGGPCQILEQAHGYRRRRRRWTCSDDCLSVWRMRTIKAKRLREHHQCECCRVWFPHRMGNVNRFCSQPCSHTVLRQQGVALFRLRSLELRAARHAGKDSALLPDAGLQPAGTQHLLRHAQTQAT